MDHREFLSNLNENLTTKPVEEFKNEEFASEVASGNIKFLSVVESLQGVLTNETVSIREKGIDFMSWLLSNLPNDLFNYSEVSVVVKYFLDCLKGHHNFIPPTIRGLLPLLRMKEITKEEIINISVNLFQHVNCQSQLQADRLILYSILQQIINNYLELITSMGPDFVYGLISYIEGESDPFCLMTIFSFMPVFIREFDLGHLGQEMFEILSCYFPIEFNSAKRDTCTITREDLAEKLLQCLVANESFSQQCIPLILEKVASAFKTAKLDSYKLLQNCCKNIKVGDLEKHLNELWKSLSKDVLRGNDQQVCEAGLRALSEVVCLLSKEESQHEIFSAFLDDILTTVRSLTNKVDDNMFQSAVRVLVAVSARSRKAAGRVLCQVKTMYNAETSSTHMGRKTILLLFLPFMRFCREFKIVDSKNPEEIAGCVELVNLYLNSTTFADCEIRKLAFAGILEILPVIGQEFRNKLYEILMGNIKTKDDIKTSDEFLKIWRYLAQNYHLEVQTVLNDSFSADKSECIARYFRALSLIADVSNFTGYVLSVFKNAIFGGPDYVTGLECLLNACRIAKSNESVEFFYSVHTDHDILECLITWCLKFEPKTELRSGSLLSLVSEVIALIMRTQIPDTQQIIVDRFIQTLSESPSPNGSGDTPTIKNLTPELVLIAEAILGSVWPEINIPMISTLREKLTKLALDSPEDCVRLSSSRLLASFVNKAKEDLELNLLAEISRDIFGLKENSELKLRLNSAFLFTWVVKGIILRGGHPSEEWICTWFDLLGRSDIGGAIAEEFRTVIEEDDLYLNIESHSNVRVLYRQRLFGNYPKLVRMYETSEESVKMNYLLALVRLLQGLPIHLIQMELSKIVTIFVKCLDVQKPEILSIPLEILTELLERKEKILSDHIQNFLPRFLNLAKSSDFMKIRINALKCLYFYGFYPTVILLPFKSQVIRELEICLDDKKRLARKEAVKARCRWFLVGAPGEDILDP